MGWTVKSDWNDNLGWEKNEKPKGLDVHFFYP